MRELYGSAGQQLCTATEKELGRDKKFSLV